MVTPPVFITTPRVIDATPQGPDWTFGFVPANKLPFPVERQVMRLLTLQLKTLLFQRLGVTLLREVTREQALNLIDEMIADDVRTIHDAVCWCYAQLLPEMLEGFEE